MHVGGESSPGVAEISVDGPSALVVLRGDIDLSNRDTILAVFDESLTVFDHIRVSLAGVTFMDSSGIGVLLALQRAAQDAGARLTVLDSTPRLERLFTVAGLSGMFTVRDPNT